MITEMAFNAILAVSQDPAARDRDRSIERFIMDDISRGLYFCGAHILNSSGTGSSLSWASHNLIRA
jgi:hypothetical protein